MSRSAKNAKSRRFSPSGGQSGKGGQKRENPTKSGDITCMRVMRKPAFCICENKGADQLCSNHTADQHLCFCYLDSSINPSSF